MAYSENIDKCDVVLRWPDVHKKVGLSRPHVHSLIRNGKFPRQIKLGSRASGWLESEINLWIHKRVQEAQGVEENGEK